MPRTMLPEAGRFVNRESGLFEQIGWLALEHYLRGRK